MIKNLSRNLLSENLHQIETLGALVGWTAENLQKDLPHKWDLSFVYESGGIIGLSIISQPGWDECRWHLLAVAPVAHGCGLGRIISEESIRRARDLGVSTMTLKCKEPLIGFHERFGFSLVKYEDSGLAFMRKKLKLT